MNKKKLAKNTKMCLVRRPIFLINLLLLFFITFVIIIRIELQIFSWTWSISFPVIACGIILLSFRLLPRGVITLVAKDKISKKVIFYIDGHCLKLDSPGQYVVYFWQRGEYPIYAPEFMVTPKTLSIYETNIAHCEINMEQKWTTDQ